MGLVENPWEEGGSAEHGQKRGGEKGLHRQRRGGRELDVWAASGRRDATRCSSTADAMPALFGETWD